MMLQTAVFDAGTIIFACAKYLHFEHGVSWMQFCRKRNNATMTTSEDSDVPSPEEKPVSYYENVWSPQFLFLVSFASIHILKLNFFVSNINGMTEEKFAPN